MPLFRRVLCMTACVLATVLPGRLPADDTATTTSSITTGETPAENSPAGKPAAAQQITAEQAEFYRTRVAPLLVQHCFSCHGPKSGLKGGLFLGSRQDILTGGESGAAVNLQQPGNSLLLQAINHQSLEMPPKGKLPDEQIAILTRWVEQGIPIPAAAETKRPAADHVPRRSVVTDEDRSYWAFRPVTNPPVPAVRQPEKTTSPIDRFILARLEAAGLGLNPPASRQQLIRRAYYDLIGLPPTVEEVDAFVADESPDAFEKVVDQLLDSPHYGEKWGRHWLDLVRFAESNSYERDGSKPYAWRFRDYVIRSLNQDKPYTQFLREQLAGDELEPKTVDSLTATGYYRLGVWDDEPVNPQQALYDDLDDIVATTSQVFLGLTLNCARCHDHKIDPIPQKDYYRFVAFFNGIRRYGVRSHESVEEASVGPLALDMATEDRDTRNRELDRELTSLNRKISDVERKLQELLSPPEKEDFKAAEVRLDLARKYSGQGISKQKVAEYEAALARRQEIEETRPESVARALLVKEIGPTPRETHILARGNAGAPGELVSPGFPQVLSPPAPAVTPPASGRTSGRRLALASWLTDEHNPLTARVMVNRLWQHHFGRGIVSSPNNFGTGGSPPSHPQLLDWLATRFVEGGWKLKSIHRMILLSSTWQQSSRGTPQGLAADPSNQLFWRFPMRRLSAEELRDSILKVNGSFNPKMGGPGFYPVIPPEVLAGQSRPGNGWGSSSPEERARRAIYIFVKRSLVEPLLADFDFADVDATCPVRFVTTQPTQTLGLLNSEFINRQARVFAAFLRQQAGDQPADQVALALSRAFQRHPQPQEIQRGVELMESLVRDGTTTDDALRYFCLLTYNFNEFLYLD